ncbi:MAG: DUF2780 domain-containing protein [Vicinamibacterales bacterium]
MNIKRQVSSIFLVVLLLATGALLPAQDAATANPELIGALAKELGSTPQQAAGAAGALFGHAKSKLSADDWSKVAGAVPGMDGLLKAAPAAGGAAGTTGTTGAIAGAAGLGGLANMASSFSKLGLKPDMVAKAVPVLTKYVSQSGGSTVGQLLAGVLK